MIFKTGLAHYDLETLSGRKPMELKRWVLVENTWELKYLKHLLHYPFLVVVDWHITRINWSHLVSRTASSWLNWLGDLKNGRQNYTFNVLKWNQHRAYCHIDGENVGNSRFLHLGTVVFPRRYSVHARHRTVVSLSCWFEHRGLHEDPTTGEFCGHRVFWYLCRSFNNNWSDCVWSAGKLDQSLFYCIS